MKEHTIERQSKWSLDEDQKKLKYMISLIESMHDITRPPEKTCAEFLLGEDAYKHSRHFMRYYLTMRKVLPYLEGSTEAHILETGGGSPILDYFARTHRCFTTETDLRLQIDAPSASMDVIFSFEVMEHIKDQPETNFADIVLFRESGVKCFVQEIFRVLKPGRLLVLTTPNPCGLRCFSNLVEGRAPMVFRPHVREYTRDEVLALFADLELLEHETIYAFFLLSEASRTPYLSAFEALGGRKELAGDDHFFAFRKPR